jgi:2-desacetyl-2-hydroxyethyl bacteriochlorophyllide A dehydrogenase
MKRTALYFTGPGRVEIREETLPSLPAGKVLVETRHSAISTGTELLIYRGLFPPDLPVDATIPGLQVPCAYPLKYGYSAVGQVIALGKGVSGEWDGRTVFSFHPHESHFIADPAELFPLPAEMAPEEALFLPNQETAVNFMMDGWPLIGEQVLVFGQGIVGLLTTSLLSLYPLKQLLTIDRHPLRRKLSMIAGSREAFDPAEHDFPAGIRTRLESREGYQGADLTFELSGSPDALQQAIAVTGFSGRIVIGSWYGVKDIRLNLGGAFHRSRIRLMSSQVSSIGPEFQGRWTKSRRLAFAAELLGKVKPTRFVTHRFPFHAAADAYACLDKKPEECVMALLTYGGS